MTDFVRARSEEQKQARMAEIKAAADELFCSVPYQEITLSTIAGKLSWTRANLYKYVTTKEEIYLEICSDKMQSYFDDLFAAFPDEKPFTPDQWAAAWADVLNAHRDYLRYSDILCTIIEVHVTACRLASFKTSYHAHRDAFVRLMEVRLGLSSHDASEVFLSVLYHAAGLCGSCHSNPVMLEAMKIAGIPYKKRDFRLNMYEFIRMNLWYYLSGPAGENSCDSVAKDLAAFLGWEQPAAAAPETPPQLPVRPPVLCAGCPHRASFFAVKEAMKGKKSVFCGDIGCYTLGNAMPLDMVDTCLCMGAGVNMTQGIGKVEPDTTCFAFVGDSTFFASAITGMVNAVYNQANMTLVVLDNSTTAMTGHQPHPGTGKTMMGQVVDKVSIVDTLHGIGVKTVETVDPLHLKEAVACVKRVASQPGVKAIIFKSPCAVLIKSGKPAEIEESKCIQCKKCIRTLGCPGIILQDGKVRIEQALCTGCGLCAQVCPTQAIGGACHA